MADARAQVVPWHATLASLRGFSQNKTSQEQLEKCSAYTDKYMTALPDVRLPQNIDWQEQGARPDTQGTWQLHAARCPWSEGAGQHRCARTGLRRALALWFARHARLCLRRALGTVNVTPLSTVRDAHRSLGDRRTGMVQHSSNPYPNRVNSLLGDTSTFLCPLPGLRSCAESSLTLTGN